MKRHPLLISCFAILLGQCCCQQLNAQEQTAKTASAATVANQDKGATDELFEGLALTPRAFRQAAEKIRPALVTIESFGGVSALQGKIGGIRKQGEGNTTGIMVSRDGLVITSSFNFIKQPPVITVVTSDGKRRIARLLGRDDTRQICLLKIRDAVDMPVPDMVDPAEIEVGQWAISVGVGYGDVNPALSMGIVSAKNRAGGRAIQTDANISPANYGGALVDIEGRMIGVCVPLNPNSASKGAGVEWYDSGIGFAIPLHGIEDLIKAMADGKSFYPAYLGVVVAPTNDGVGVVIENVDSIEARRKAAAARRNAPKPKLPNLPEEDKDDEEDKAEETEEDRLTYQYPALEAGLKKGDIILSINGKKLFDARQLKIVISGYTAGDKIKLRYSRSTAAEKKEKKEDSAKDKEKPEGENSEDEKPDDEQSGDEKPDTEKQDVEKQDVEASADKDKAVKEAKVADAERVEKEVEITLGRPPKMWLNEGIPPLNIQPKEERKID